MGSQQYKNTFNNITSNRALPEPIGSILARPEHPNADEAEEHDLKNSFIKITGALQGEMRNSLKEREEKTKNERNQ